MPVKTNLPPIVRREVRSLGIPPCLLGYRYLLHAVEAVAIDPMRIKGLTTDLYREIAQRYATTPGAVARNIRTAINACWNGVGRDRLSTMAAHPITERPWPAAFIAIVAEYANDPPKEPKTFAKSP